jgi:hypothetical protein
LFGYFDEIVRQLSPTLFLPQRTVRHEPPLDALAFLRQDREKEMAVALHRLIAQDAPDRFAGRLIENEHQ